MGSRRVMSRTVSPILAATPSIPDGIPRASQYENAQVRPVSGTTRIPRLFDGGCDSDITMPLSAETLSTKPESTERTPVAEMNRDTTGILSEISFPNKSCASFSEIMFSLMEKLDSTSGTCERECFGL
jgi:hypothetical protein